MNVPDTCFANNKAAVREFSNNYDIVCLKSIDNDNIWFEEEMQEHVLYTQAVKSKDLLALPDEAFSQTVTYLQNYIPKAYELRVTVVGTEVFPCRIDSQEMETGSGKIDWRQGLDKGLHHSKYHVPKAVSDFCTAFLKRLSLNFGCFDFIVTPENDYVFLECNPNGQWLWIEQETGLPISKCIADTLIIHDKNT